MITAARLPQKRIPFLIAQVVCAAGLVLTGCSSGGPRTIEAGPRLGTAASVRLQVEDTLVVRLAANPGTGYAWARSATPTLLQLVDSTMIATAAGDRVGAPGEQLFRFIARAGGGAELSFHYRRPWETNAPAADSVRMTVHVEER